MGGKRKAKARKYELSERRWQHGDWCVERIRLSMVLQDCADQMAVLGHIAQSANKGRPKAEEDTWETELEKSDLPEEEKEKLRTHMELRDTLDNKPLSPDKLEQVEQDQQFLAQVIKNILDELQETGRFDSLLAAVEEEKRKKAHFLDVIQREEEGRLQIKAHQRRLREIRKEWGQEGRHREEFTAHLHAQLQEMRAKGTMERDYNRGISELKVQQAQEHNLHREGLMDEKVQILLKKVTEEHYIHDEMENFLLELLSGKETKLEKWMSLYDRDMEERHKKLDVLRNKSAKVKERMQELLEEVAQEEAAREEAEARALVAQAMAAEGGYDEEWEAPHQEFEDE